MGIVIHGNFCDPWPGMTSRKDAEEAKAKNAPPKRTQRQTVATTEVKIKSQGAGSPDMRGDGGVCVVVVPD